MNRFNYKASTHDNEIITGEAEAANLSEAISGLEQKGLSVLSIEICPKKSMEADQKMLAFHRRIEEILASRAEWMPVLEALGSELPSLPLRRRFQSMFTPLKTCASAEEFLASRDTVLLLPLCTNTSHIRSNVPRIPSWLPSLIHAVEAQQRRRQAFAYPVALGILALLVLIIANVFMLDVFESLRNEWPWNQDYNQSPKSGLLSPSHPFSHHPMRAFGLMVCTVTVAIGFVYAWRRYAMTDRLLSSLVAGSSKNLAAMSVLTGTLAEFLALDAPIWFSLQAAGQSCRHYFFQQAAQQLSDDLDTGKQSVDNLSRKSIGFRRLPPLLIHAMSSAADGSPSVPLLREIASNYNERLRLRMDWITAVCPLLMIIVIGVIVYGTALIYMDSFYNLVVAPFSTY